MDLIPFCKPFLGVEEEQAVLKVMRTGWLAAGEKTKEFEEEFAKYVGVKHAIFTNSGTAALKMAYKYASEELGRKYVDYPINTFCATYSAAKEMGLSLFVEEADSDNIIVKVNVHYGGVKDLNYCFLEDSAHRIEKDDPLIGKIRIYSFYVTKNMTTGAGGMFVTDDTDIYNLARLYWMDGINKSTFDRQHGGWNYEVEVAAGGYDGNDIAAAIGLEQLKKLPYMTAKRNVIRDRYNDAFDQEWEGNHLYPFMVESVEDVGRLIKHLKEDGIQASYHYPGTGWKGVSLPIYPNLGYDQQERIIKSVRSFK